jgi:hypothetical protein
MFKIGFYLISLIFPVFLGVEMLKDKPQEDKTEVFKYLKESYSTDLMIQELGVINKEIQRLKPNVSFPENQLRALLLLVSDNQSLASATNKTIVIDRVRLSIADDLPWHQWIEGLELSSINGVQDSFDYFYWSEKLSEALNYRISAKDLYLTSLFVDEQRVR